MVDVAYMPEVLSYHPVVFPELLSNVLSLGSHWNIPVRVGISLSIFFSLAVIQRN